MLPLNSTAPVKLTSGMKHGLSKCLVVIQFLITFKLAVSSLEGVWTVLGPLQSNQRSSGLCLYSKWGMWAFTIKGLGHGWEVHRPIYQQKSNQSNHELCNSPTLGHKALPSSEPNAWIHSRSFWHEIIHQLFQVCHPCLLALAKPWDCKWKHLSLQAQPLDNIWNGYTYLPNNCVRPRFPRAWALLPCKK